MPNHMTHLTTHCSLRRNESVIETLMIALSMIVGEVLVEHVIEGAFTQHDHPFQGLLLDRADEPLAVGIQIGAPGRQDDQFGQVVAAKTRIRQAGAPPPAYPSLRPPAPALGGRPTSRRLSPSLRGIPTRSAKAGGGLSDSLSWGATRSGGGSARGHYGMALAGWSTS